MSRWVNFTNPLLKKEKVMIHQHTSSLIARGLLLFAVCLFAFGVAAGQSATATLSGEVVDQNGAVIPGANITVLNTATSLRREAITNDSGNFTVPLLPPGTYKLAAVRDGFSPVEVRNVILNG